MNLQRLTMAEHITAPWMDWEVSFLKIVKRIEQEMCDESILILIILNLKRILFFTRL